jgi:hypothetical protein
MRTIELIAELDEKEKKEFTKKLKAHSRKSLLNLYVLLLKSSPEPDKKKLFNVAFGKNYTAAKDYLLRNELRLLNHELEQFIIDAEMGFNHIDISTENDLKLLNRFFKNGSENLFEKYYSTALLKTIKAQDFEKQSKLHSLKCDFLIKHKELSIANYKELLETLQLENNALQLFAEEKKSENVLKQRYTQRVLMQLNGSNNWVENTNSTNVDGSMSLNPVVQYNNLIAQSYIEHGESKISLLQKALKLHPLVAEVRKEKAKDILTINGNIAIEYFLNHRFDEAHKYYATATSLMNDDNLNIELVFNYCINAMVIGKHKIFIEYSQKYARQISGNNKLKYRFQYFTAIALLFDNKPNEAFRCLDHEISKRPETEYYFYRMVYAMVYFQLNDFDLANRELENILQSFRFRKTTQQDDKPLAKLMQKLLHITSLQHNSSQYKAALKKFRIDSTESLSGLPRFSTIINTWMQKQVETMIKKVR